jgi:hypothetical protein
MPRTRSEDRSVQKAKWRRRLVEYGTPVIPATAQVVNLPGANSTSVTKTEYFSRELVQGAEIDAHFIHVALAPPAQFCLESRRSGYDIITQLVV